MQIKDTDVYKLNYFTYNRAFTGSYGNMRYRLVPKKRRRGGSGSVGKQSIHSHIVGRRQTTKKNRYRNSRLRKREEVR